MKTFNMYVKTIVSSEHGKILLIKQKRMDNKPRWDLPGAPLTEEQSFDETVVHNIQKEIGYSVYPGKILGVSSHVKRDMKDLYVIMEGTILNGDLILSTRYDEFAWIDIRRIAEYPLVPWLNEYIKNTSTPFEDVAIEIDELNDKNLRRREVIQENLINGAKEYTHEANSEISENVKNSFSMLKNTIKRTFHPKEAKITKTVPKDNIYTEDKDDTTTSFTDKFNIRKRNTEDTQENKEIILKESSDDIIIERNDIIISQDDDIVPDQVNKPTSSEKPKKNYFDMNINRQNNMKKEEIPSIKVIQENEEVPHIRKEKESTEKVSFNSENIKRSGWKARLNEINRTDANNEKKTAPLPKGKRRN
ncbi:NUDIX hydrolase [Methanosphaera sp.]